MKKLLGLILMFCIVAPFAMAEEEGGVNHVVLCWLKSKDEAGMKKFQEAVADLKKIPSVKSVSVGKKIHSDEPVADNSFDIGFVITFKDTKGLGTYLVHPDHVKAVETVLKPALEKVVVYDFAGQ